MTIHNRYLTILAIAVPVAADVPSCAAPRDIIKYLYYANSGMEAYLGQLQWLWGFNFPFFIFVYSVDASFEGIKYTDIKHGGVVLHNGGWNHDCVCGWVVASVLPRPVSSVPATRPPEAFLKFKFTAAAGSSRRPPGQPHTHCCHASSQELAGAVSTS